MTLDEQGEPLLMAGICVDISARKRTEEDLRFVAQASAELAALDQLPDTQDRIAQLAVPSFADWCAVDLLDANGAIDRVAVAHVDPAKVALAHRLFARNPPRPDAPNGFWQVIRHARCEHVAEISDALLVAAATDAEHLDTLRALGLRSYIAAPLAVRGKVLGVISFVSAEGGRIYGPDDVALAEDIGRRAAIAIENANLYRSLQQADRRKDDFLAMLAHELRNPLAPIRAAAELLGHAVDDPRLSRLSEVITRQVGHMTGLVDDLLDVSRVTRGQVELDCWAAEASSWCSCRAWRRLAKPPIRRWDARASCRSMYACSISVCPTWTARSWRGAISGYGQEHDRASALDAGFDQYLVKPVGALSLQETLAGVGAQPR